MDLKTHPNHDSVTVESQIPFFPFKKPINYSCGNILLKLLTYSVYEKMLSDLILLERRENRYRGTKKKKKRRKEGSKVGTKE